MVRAAGKMKMTASARYLAHDLADNIAISIDILAKIRIFSLVKA